MSAGLSREKSGGKTGGETAREPSVALEGSLSVAWAPAAEQHWWRRALLVSPPRRVPGAAPPQLGATFFAFPTQVHPLFSSFFLMQPWVLLGAAGSCSCPAGRILRLAPCLWHSRGRAPRGTVSGWVGGEGGKTNQMI